jgi:hypothetical protein
MRRKRDVVRCKWTFRAVGIQVSAQNIARMAIVGYQRFSDRPFSPRVIIIDGQTRSLGTSSRSDFLRKNGWRGNSLGRYDISCGHQINPLSIDGTHVSFMSCSSSDYHLSTTCQISGRERPLQCPSPAAMTLKRTLGPTPLPFNSSVYHFELDIDDEKAQCYRQTSILYHIFDFYPFFYPILFLLAVSVPHKLSLRFMLNRDSFMTSNQKSSPSS